MPTLPVTFANAAPRADTAPAAAQAPDDHAPLWQALLLQFLYGGAIGSCLGLGIATLVRIAQ